MQSLFSGSGGLEIRGTVLFGPMGGSFAYDFNVSHYSVNRFGVCFK